MSSALFVPDADSQPPASETLLRNVQTHAESRGAILGNPSGTTTLLEFYDFNCGPCREADAVLERFVQENAELKIVLIDYPILGPDSHQAAERMLQLSGPSYVQVYSAIMSHPGRVNGDRVRHEAQLAGVDPAALSASTIAADAEIANNATAAANLGALGVPTFYFNGQSTSDLAGLARALCGYRGPGTCSNYVALLDDAKDAHRRGAEPDVQQFLARAVTDAQHLNFADGYNEVCWDGALLNEAATVMPACQAAVDAAPQNASFRDSRGLARALQGDRAGAIADFNYFLNSSTGSSSQRLARQTAIDLLSANRPVPNETLIALLRY